MSRKWSEKQSATLLGKWFSLKSLGYRLLLIDVSKSAGQVELEYILRRGESIESVKAGAPINSILPSVTMVFPEGEQMQREIAQRYPVAFQSDEPGEAVAGCSMLEWGPFHPLLPQPVQFKIWMTDEVIRRTELKTGYNYRGLEELCVGKKPEDALDMLERTSGINGYLLGLAFVHAVEKVEHAEVPEKAGWLRMFLAEMCFLHAALLSLNHTARCLGLQADSARLFRLISLYQEAAALISDSPQFSGMLEIGGLTRDITRETLFAVHAILQEMEPVLKDIRNRWENTPTIAKRLLGAGKIESAGLATGRLLRAAGFSEDMRRVSVLPWHMLSYSIPCSEGNDCYARAMLMFGDALLSLDLIGQMAEAAPKGTVKESCRVENSGDTLICEPEAYGMMAVRIRQEEGKLQSVRIRNAAALNISFLPECLKGMEINDLPLAAATFELDLSAMEK